MRLPARFVRALVGATLLLTACGGGNDSDSEPRFSPEVIRRLDAAIEGEMRAADLPSVAVFVSVPGEGEYAVARGKANLATGRPRRLDDPFRIASITKTFVATAVLQLVDQGLLRTSDPLSRWYPDFPRADAITVGDLLRMRSGIADPLNQDFLREYYADLLTNLTPQQVIDRAAARAGDFTDPDTETVYTNVNYVLLEEIVRRVSGNDIATYLERAVFKPLGMVASSYPHTATAVGPTHGYSKDETTGELRDVTVLDPSPAGGAGAMISTIRDLRAYAQALCTGVLLRPPTQAERLQTTPLEGAPPFVGYGEGLIRFGRFCGHNGTIFGFSSELWYLPEKNAVIVINVNRLDVDDASKSLNLFLYVTKILFPDLVDWPQVTPPGS